jgi:hypothetical protein
MSVARAARGEAIFREVNDRIYELSRMNGTAEFLCECGDSGCLVTLEMTPDDYVRVRARRSAFLLRAEHVDRSIEVVVEERPSFVVVEKLGAAAEIAEAAARELASDEP